MPLLPESCDGLLILLLIQPDRWGKVTLAQRTSRALSTAFLFRR